MTIKTIEISVKADISFAFLRQKMKKCGMIFHGDKHADT